MRKLYFLLPLFLLVFSVPVFAQKDTPSGLDLVIALDLSGSMDRTTDKNGIARVDLGWYLLRKQVNSNQLNPTDPNGLRFDITEMLLEWLGQYADLHSDKLSIKASVVGFQDKASVLMDPTELGSRNTDGRMLQPLKRDGIMAEGSKTAQNSNFVDLYQQIATLLAKSPEDHQRAVLIITDSVPCFPKGQRSGNNPIYGGQCEDVQTMINHVGALPSLPNTDEYVLFVNGVSTAQRWQPYPNLKSAWESSINGSFVDLDSITDLPASMTNAVLREVALAQNFVSKEKLAKGVDLSSDVYSKLGIAYSVNGQFNVGPYQQSIEVLTALPQANAQVEFTPTGSSTSVKAEALYGSASQVLRASRITQPQAGQWTTRVQGASPPTWVLFSPAKARLRLVPEVPTRFTQQRIVYELVDNKNQSFPITEKPAFKITVTTPNGTSIDLSTMQPGDDGKSFISPPFLPIVSGLYHLTTTVGPGTSPLWQNNANSDFLIPEPITTIPVAGVTFTADFEVIKPQSKNTLGIGEVSTNTVTLPRSLPLEIHVKANLEDGTETTLPEGMGAKLLFTQPKNGNACPTNIPPVKIDPSTRKIAQATVKFENAGTCDVEVKLSINSDLPPVSGTPQDMPVQTGNRSVTITSTEHLSIRLVGDDKQLISGNSANPAKPQYQIIDRDSMPLQWNYNTVVLRLEIVNDNGDLVEPQFLPDAQPLDRDYCSAQAKAESTPDASRVALAVDNDRIVPITLKITRADQDVAKPRGICFYATDTDGVYLASATGLEAGDYVVQASVDPNQPLLDYQHFEYAPGVPNEVSASLHVAYNPAMIIQIGGTAGVIALIVLGTLFVTGRTAVRRIAPLDVTPAIYRVPKALGKQRPNDEGNSELDQPLESLWIGKVPRINDYEFLATDFVQKQELALLNIERLTLTTRGKRDVSNRGGAFANLIIDGGDVLKGEELTKGAVRKIAEDRHALYFLVNDVDAPTAKQLLSNIL